MYSRQYVCRYVCTACATDRMDGWHDMIGTAKREWKMDDIYGRKGKKKTRLDYRGVCSLPNAMRSDPDAFCGVSYVYLTGVVRTNRTHTRPVLYVQLASCVTSDVDEIFLATT
jgi:hypothetical protein